MSWGPRIQAHSWCVSGWAGHLVVALALQLPCTQPSVVRQVHDLNAICIQVYVQVYTIHVHRCTGQVWPLNCVPMCTTRMTTVQLQLVSGHTAPERAGFALQQVSTRMDFQM